MVEHRQAIPLSPGHSNLHMGSHSQLTHLTATASSSSMVAARQAMAHSQDRSSSQHMGSSHLTGSNPMGRAHMVTVSSGVNQVLAHHHMVDTTPNSMVVASQVDMVGSKGDPSTQANRGAHSIPASRAAHNILDSRAAHSTQVRMNIYF